MRIIAGQYPPLIDLIDAKFNVRGRQVFFCWGDKIYNPSGVEIHPMIIDHETMHSKRQGDDVEGWWQLYVEDQKFRLIEEVLGHTAEYRYRLRTEGNNRNMRRIALARTAIRLVDPLYQYNPKVPVHRAKAMILEAHEKMEEYGCIPTWTAKNLSLLGL